MDQSCTIAEHHYSPSGEKYGFQTAYKELKSNIVQMGFEVRCASASDFRTINKVQTSGADVPESGFTLSIVLVFIFVAINYDLFETCLS